MADHRLILRYALSELRPTPQRLRRLIELFAGWGYRELYLDWCDSFPWKLDERLRSADAFGEALVSGLVQEARSRGIELHAVFPAPDSLDFVVRVPVYRRLFRSEGGRPVLDLASRAACKFYTDLFDDFADLLPDASAIMLDYRASSFSLGLFTAAVRPFRTRGRRLTLRYEGLSERLSAELPSLREAFDVVVVPIAGAAPLLQSYPGRLVGELSIPMTEPREAASEVLHSAGYGDGQPLVLSFQKARASGAAVGVGELLEASIEEALPAVRFAAESLSTLAESVAHQSDSIAELHPGAGGLGRPVAAALDEGWRAVRAARESLGEPRPGPGAIIESLAEAYRRACAAAAELRKELTEIVDSERLDRALRRSLGAIYEEYLELCGRAGVSVTAAAPDSPGDGQRLATDRFSC